MSSNEKYVFAGNLIILAICLPIYLIWEDHQKMIDKIDSIDDPIVLYDISFEHDNTFKINRRYGGEGNTCRIDFVFTDHDTGKPIEIGCIPSNGSTFVIKEERKDYIFKIKEINREMNVDIKIIITSLEQKRSSSKKFLSHFVFGT